MLLQERGHSHPPTELLCVVAAAAAAAAAAALQERGHSHPPTELLCAAAAAAAAAAADALVPATSKASAGLHDASNLQFGDLFLHLLYVLQHGVPEVRHLHLEFPPATSGCGIKVAAAVVGVGSLLSLMAWAAEACKCGCDGTRRDVKGRGLRDSCSREGPQLIRGRAEQVMLATNGRGSGLMHLPVSTTPCGTPGQISPEIRFCLGGGALPPLVPAEPDRAKHYPNAAEVHVAAAVASAPANRACRNGDFEAP
eukprot:CAMPEP_0172780510 /NCGR_PEP_ID=MMETSP1074-20121228/202965_1 /TAXON_ID=2916 /ORGANISM="Ceratium fusus, Strain PA161109" /LENGTH=253 /DNA_ID=CAMNT_0013617487 /DNA_START=1566 /DNA_END=2331 /DNA_ORIENTATION=+